MKTLLDPVVAPIFFTLVAGLLAYILARFSPGACKILAVAAAGGAGALHVASLASGAAAKTFQWQWGQPLWGNVTLTVELSATTLGSLVLIGSAAFALLVSIYSLRAMAGSYWEGKFYAYLIWALAGACIVALAGNLLVLLVGWELVTLMLFLMVNQGRREAKAGGMKAYAVLGFADACLLLAVALLLAAGGSEWLRFGPARDVSAVGSALGAAWMGYLVYVLILVASLAKAGAIPLHTWVPAIARDAPTPVMAYLPAAMDKLLGIYLLAVLSLRMFRPDGAMQVVMMVIGAVTILAAVLMAVVQHNLKRLLSFHAVSQVGYMVLGIGTGTAVGVVGGLFHMVNNAIYKSGLFLMSGTVGDAAGSDELEEMGGLARRLPVTFACGAIAAAAISGVPPLNGFVSKWLLYQGALQVPHHGLAIALVVVAVFGSALTLASFVKAIYSAFLSPAPKRPGRARAEVRESVARVAPMVVLAAACVFLGLFPGAIVRGALLPGVQGAVTGEESLSVGRWLGVDTGGLGLWSPKQAIWLVGIGLVLGLLLLLVATHGARVRVVRPFLAGEIAAAGDDRWRIPGTHFYETLAKLPVVGPLLSEGEAGAMDAYRWTGKHGQTFVEMLRRQHTGLLSLYAAWALLGVVATLVYLLLTMRT